MNMSIKNKKKHKTPGYSEFFLDTLKVIASKGGSASISEIYQGVIDLRGFSDEIIDELDIKDPNDVLILCLITLGRTLNESTVNLKAPIIINIKNNKGKQLILQDDKYKIKEPLDWV